MDFILLVWQYFYAESETKGKVGYKDVLLLEYGFSF